MPSHLGPRSWGRAIATLLAISLIAAANASADVFSAVAQVYAQTQTIPPCRFSSAELAQAQSSVPSDAQQYEQDLIAAIDQARQERADGACLKRYRVTASAATAGMPVPPAPGRLGRATRLGRLPPLDAATASGMPGPVAILELLGLLLLGAGAAVAVAPRLGWDPAWLGRPGHAWSEAGYRVSGLCSEFGDWLRQGR
jgi:hypothetical protein